MAKKCKDDVTKADITRYLEGYSDFAFEVKVLNVMSSLGISCTHSGTYTDPVTGKFREYDIRGRHDKELKSSIKIQNYFAVECKNLSTVFPLVVHCVTRKQSEAFLDIILSYHYQQYGKVASTRKFRNDLHRYIVNEPVGKSTDQVGKHATTNEIISSDGDVFDKISQAINSSKDLITSAATSGQLQHLSLSFINPLLVVPDKTLWRVVYNESGNIISGPEMVEAISYFYSKEWSYAVDKREDVFTISHLDIVTYSALDQHLTRIISMDDDKVLEFCIDKLRRNPFPGATDVLRKISVDVDPATVPSQK